MKAKQSRLDKEDGVRRKVARKRVTRGSVLKMLAAKEKPPGDTSAAADPVADFLTTGRTGRRNAMPDILGSHANTSVADLPDCLGKLHTADPTTPSGSGGLTPCNPFGPSTSRANAPEVSNAAETSPTEPCDHGRDKPAS